MRITIEVSCFKSSGGKDLRQKRKNRGSGSDFDQLTSIIERFQRTSVVNFNIGGRMMEWRMFFLNPAVVWILIPLAAILISGIKSLFHMYYEHVERIAMIQQGIMPPERSDASVLADDC